MQAAGEVPEVPIELEDINALRQELPELRAHCDHMARELRKLRRSLALTKSRHKEAHRTVCEREAEVVDISRRLGCPEEGLPEIDEWRQLAKEELAKSREIKQQIEEEQLEHERLMASLHAKIARQGRPESATALEAEENKRKRQAADERCGRLQLVRDYILGRLPEMTSEQLEELLRPEHSELEAEDPQDETAWSEDTSEELENMLEHLQRQHAEDIAELVEFSNQIIGHKNNVLLRLERGILLTAMENPERCNQQEHAAIHDVLDDAETICNLRQAEGAPLPSTQGAFDESLVDDDRSTGTLAGTKATAVDK
eukprot:TRINITY_DN45745_c0_g1_i1.p1 TRINITY_DN45745_c0_g1~~TRINITY_DN45745_c0_g1_i1.p1  ORF type:complete len:314 (-),score=98.68 TRINITY_DN45745_c0_g1_i1:49-990(-)